MPNRGGAPVTPIDRDGNIIGGSTSPITVSARNYTPLGYQQISEPATSTALIVPTNAKFAFVQNNGSQPARWRDDGQAATASTGQRIPAGQTLTYDGNLSAFRVIREAAGVTLDILYYG